MIYSVEDILRDVRVSLDQNMRSEPLLALEDIDALSLDELIRSKIEEATDRVHGAAPAHRLECGHNFGDAVYWGEKESGWVYLPDDFMRLVSFEMSDWERSVSTVLTAEAPEYALQRQRIKALRGTAQKPVCAIVQRPEGRALEFYSCKSEEAYVRRGQYIPYAKIENGGIDISERCYRAVVYMTASIVTMSLGEAEKAAALAETAKINMQ